MALQNSVYNVITNGIVRSGTTAGNTGLLQAYNNTGSAYTTFATLTAGLTPTFDLNTLTTINSAYIYRQGGTPVNIATGGTNLSSTPTDGQLLIGNSNTNAYTLATITQGSGVTVTNGHGTITIAASGGGPSWSAKSTAFAIAANGGYQCSSAATGTLPATAAVGDTYYLMGITSAGWIVAQNSGQSIVFGAQTTTVGAGGSLAAITAGDCVTIVCTATNTGFMVLNAVGNITVA